LTKHGSRCRTKADDRERVDVGGSAADGAVSYRERSNTDAGTLVIGRIPELRTTGWTIIGTELLNVDGVDVFEGQVRTVVTECGLDSNIRARDRLRSFIGRGGVGTRASVGRMHPCFVVAADYCC